MNSKVEFSSLYEYSSLKDYLLDYHKLSKQKIKKLLEQTKLSKGQLNKRVFPKKQYELPIGMVNEGLINPTYNGEKIDILFENDKWMAISKPAACHSHPLSYDDKNNALSFLRNQGHFKVININTENYDRGLLYRIDFETSGLLLLTKDESLYHDVRKNFNDKAKQKVYLTIVEGEAPEEGQLTHYLSQSGKKIKVSQTGKEADLEFHRISFHKEKNLSLLGVKLNTGLRHQIRVQLSEVGMPILGDSLYGGSAASRLFLHSYFYRIDTDDGEIKALCEWPDLVKIFGNLDSCFDMFRNKFHIS